MLHPSEVKFDSVKSTLLLSLNKDDFKSRLENLHAEAASRSLKEKTELHITVIGFAVGKIIQEHFKALSKEDRIYLEEELRELIRETDWSFATQANKAFFITKEYVDYKNSDVRETRYSIIQTIELPSLEKFYASLNDLMGTAFEAQFAHVTLFVGGTDPEKSLIGIGIDSLSAFHQLHPVEL